MRKLLVILSGMTLIGSVGIATAATDDITNSTSGSTSTEMQADGSSMKNDSSMEVDADTSVPKDSSKKAAEGRTTGKGKNLNKGKAENLPPEEGGRKP